MDADSIRQFVFKCICLVCSLGLFLSENILTETHLCFRWYHVAKSDAVLKNRIARHQAQQLLLYVL